MKRKLIVLVFASVVLLVAFGAAACAENESGSDVRAFDSSWGARVRLLQLDAALERNILDGNAIVDAIRQGNSSVDTSELESILAEMLALDEQVKATVPQSGDEGAQAFVDLKSDAINLTKSFRKEARSLLKEAEIEGLRGQIKEINSERLRQLKDEINATRHEYNADALENALGEAGLSNPGLVDAVRSGEAKWKDVMDYLKGALGNMSREDRKEVIQTLREQDAKKGVFVRAVADKMELKAAERQQERLQERLELADSVNLSESARSKLEGRIEKVGGRIEKIENKTERRITFVQNWTDKHVEKLMVLKGRLLNRTSAKAGRIQGVLDTGNLTDTQTQRLEGRLDKVQNKSENMMDKLDSRIDKVEERGQMMQDRLNGSWHGGGKSDEEDDSAGGED